MCFEINGLKCLKLTILKVFCPYPSHTYTTLIAVKTFLLLKHHLLFINSHNVYTYILKCIFWGNNYFRVYGCWLVWLLLYVFMVADWLVWLLICLTILFSKTEPGKKKFYQSFHHKWNFCNIDMYKYKFKMYNRLWKSKNEMKNNNKMTTNVTKTS